MNHWPLVSKTPVVYNRRSCVGNQSLSRFRGLPINETLNSHLLTNVVPPYHQIKRCELPFRHSDSQQQNSSRETLISLYKVVGLFPGCQCDVEDLVTDDLHPLTWLQRDDLVPIDPIDRDIEEGDCVFDWNTHFDFFSHAQIAFLAIEAVPRKACTLMEIVFWCMQNFPGEISADS